MNQNLQIKCEHCGTTNYGVLHNCLKCGSPLPVEEEKVDTQQDSRFDAPTLLEEPNAYLEVTSGSDSGHRYELFDGIKFGRSRSCDIVIDSPRASREHALIEQNTYLQWLLVDLGSTNGTLHNQKRVTRPTVLYNGDEIQIGDFIFKVGIKKPYHVPQMPDQQETPDYHNEQPLSPLPERKGCLSNTALIVIAVVLVIACVCTGLYLVWNLLNNQGILDAF